MEAPLTEREKKILCTMFALYHPDFKYASPQMRDLAIQFTILSAGLSFSRQEMLDLNDLIKNFSRSALMTANNLNKKYEAKQDLKINLDQVKKL